MITPPLPDRLRRLVRLSCMGWAVSLLLGNLAGVALAQASLEDRLTVRSVSGQFSISGPKQNVARLSDGLLTLKTNEVWLQAPVLAVSVERIKEALNSQLGMRDRLTSRVMIHLHTGTNPVPPVVIQSIRSQQGWNYRVDLPERIDQETLMGALTSVCLLELAGRGAGGREGELPLWLVEGMSRHLQATALIPLVLQSELDWHQPKFFRPQRLPDPYAAVRAQFASRPPLQLAQLDQPLNAKLSDADREQFRCCAQLLVGELLKLPNGQASMFDFIRRLPDYLNWQLAFHRAFRSQLPTPLEFEKWWAVTLVSVQGRDASLKLSLAEGLRQLTHILAVPVTIRQSPDALPEEGVTTLQAIIKEGSPELQRTVVTDTVQQLSTLQWNVQPDLLKLIEDYRSTLDSYLVRRGKLAGATQGRNNSTTNYGPLAQETVAKLNLLDLLHGDFVRYGISAAAGASDSPKARP